MVPGGAVTAICLWGTLMGCVIPIIIRQLGGDPAIASGALVATLVDVTGIAIFFSAASRCFLNSASVIGSCLQTKNGD